MNTKNILSITLACTLVACASTQSTHNVRQAKTLPEDSPVVLEGYITGRAGTLNPEEYFFKDRTDMIKVEIDFPLLKNQSITPQTKVRLHGKVDHNRFTNTTEIEVDALEILK